MNLSKKPFISIVIASLLGGCATDPLTETMKKYGYVAAIPAPATLHIGSIYDTADLKDPYMLMRDKFSSEENNVLMASLKDDVSIPNSSGEEKFSVSAEADIVGKAKLELETYGISKFKVSFGGVNQYLISKTKFEDDLYPKIISKLPGKIIDKKFTLVSLLQVSNLEYEFFDDNGGKVNIKPGSEIEKVLKAKIGTEWSANQKDNLSIGSPKFIGYRMAKLTNSGFRFYSISANLGQFAGHDKSSIASSIGDDQIQLQDIPIDELRNSAK